MWSSSFTPSVDHPIQQLLHTDTSLASPYSEQVNLVFRLTSFLRGKFRFWADDFLCLVTNLWTLLRVSKYHWTRSVMFLRISVFIEIWWFVIIQHKVTGIFVTCLTFFLMFHFFSIEPMKHLMKLSCDLWKTSCMVTVLQIILCFSIYPPSAVAVTYIIHIGSLHVHLTSCPLSEINAKTLIFLICKYCSTNMKLSHSD